MAQQINLFSPLFLRQRKYFSALTMVQALGLIALGCMLLYGYAIFQTGSLSVLSQQADARLKAGREQLIKLSADMGPQGRSKLLDDEAARLEFQLGQREVLLSNLRSNAGADAASFSPYLTALARQSTQGVWLTGVSISGGAASLTLRGRALDAERVPAYIRTLNREAVIQGRQISDLALAAKEEREAPGRYVEFTMSLSTPPGAGARKSSKDAS
jgi:hypothetical protein